MIRAWFGQRWPRTTATASATGKSSHHHNPIETQTQSPSPAAELRSSSLSSSSASASTSLPSEDRKPGGYRGCDQKPYLPPLQNQSAEDMDPTHRGQILRDEPLGIANTFPLKKFVHIHGTVVPGFQRGSKLLGIPTANLPADKFEQDLCDMDEGVWVGYACVDRGEVYKTVLSIGSNPFFKNKKKTIEPHILHKFDSDFYGKELRLSIVGYIRPQMTYSSLDALINAIQNDIHVAEMALDHPVYTVERKNNFFRDELTLV